MLNWWCMWLLRLGSVCGFCLVLIRSHSPGEASCHAVRCSSNPLERSTWWETEVPAQQPACHPCKRARSFFFKILFIFREREREGKKERTINVFLPLTCSVLGTWSATQACDLTGNGTGNPLVAGRCSVHWITPARAQESSLESTSSSPSHTFRWHSLSWHVTNLVRPHATTTQLSLSQSPKPLKLWNNKCVLFF